MIQILDDFDYGFIKFLNDKHFTDEVVKLSVIHGYESVGGDDVNYDGEVGSNAGFAMYVSGLRIIALPTERPEEAVDYKEFVIHNLAHEYKHFLQDVNGEDFDEAEADQFADEMVEEYMKGEKNV